MPPFITTTFPTAPLSRTPHSRRHALSNVDYIFITVLFFGQWCSPYLSLVHLINPHYELPTEMPSSQTQMGLKQIHLFFITNTTTIPLVTQNWLLGQLSFFPQYPANHQALKCLLVVIRIHLLPPPPQFTSLIIPSLPSIINKPSSSKVLSFSL